MALVALVRVKAQYNYPGPFSRPSLEHISSSNEDDYFEDDGGKLFSEHTKVSNGKGYTIHKHVYVHVPPPEFESSTQKRIIAPRRPEKHYKIIFIKAPTVTRPTAPVLPIHPQKDEKTLIYVLVRKPNEAPQITLPTVVPTPPSKPEVYFIKYKSKEQEGKRYFPDISDDSSGSSSDDYIGDSLPVANNALQSGFEA